ncbi:uncharacterized protein KY384_006376 [Bacidia gigantensis]|uniref:uncharacterized protein n=1 Tax=Bacidia gigantensis TaxID=2732470 RepID=UPI001D055AC3|nr:uncharacterized protein KY384_006376 [Bacidia gigantensis]KAG8528689.1 hypothetical protein KY384_006376 [Bacidia gigantensis]
MENSHSLSLRQRVAEEELLNWKGEEFVPFASLRDLLQPQVVKHVFQECEIEKYLEDEAIGAVLKGGHRVFAILNRIGQEISILLFKKNADAFLSKSLDSGLPYDQHFLESVLPDFFQEFYRYQWKFASPVFQKNLHDRDLSKNTILPFIKVEGISSQGAFAEVILVQKKLNLSNNVEWNFKHEKHVLSMLRTLKHPNIVEFHAAFTFQGRPTLLFGEAECDLKEWLRGDRSVRLSEVGTLEALYGLSSALCRMHQFSLEGQQFSMIGCHFDLHPGNVIVRGRSFILSDFGLSRLKYETQGSRSYFKGGIRDYCAPECQRWEDDFDRNKIGRPSDIWSFGCIIAEIATFLKDGATGLRRFDEARRIRGSVPMLKTFHDRGRPHQGVTASIEELKSDVFKYTIVTGLANLVSSILAIDPMTRPDAHRVSAQLYSLCLNIIYCETRKLLECLIPTAHYGWKIEYDRLTLWGRELGLGSPLPDETGAEWLLEPSSTIQFDNIRCLLLQIKDDCEVRSQYFSNDRSEERNTVPIHVIRVSIDNLWQTQKPETIRKMNTALESIILSVDDTHVSQMANFLPNGSRPQLLLAIKQAMRATNDNMNIKESFLVDEDVISRHQDWQQRLLGKTRMNDEKTEYFLTEFLQYDDSWIGHSKELINRINALVCLLSKLQIGNSLPLLQCRSFCHCPKRQAYGIMYEMPKQLIVDDRMPQPLNLAEMILKTTSRPKRPALGEVFNLAYTLAASMLSFHKAGWLHKGICAYNLIFFPRNADSPGDSLSTFRLIGFNYSRESDIGITTKGPPEDRHVRNYQHPEYRKNIGKIRFRESFDYYSLGLVLLELGRWKSLRSMTKVKEIQLLAPQDLKTHLLEEEVTQLKSFMGVYYHDAVAACFGEFHAKEVGSSNKQVWYDFDQKVVQRLVNCLAIHVGNG